MGKLFRKADVESTVTYFFGPDEEGDERDWIRVRDSLTKSEVNKLLASAPTEQGDIEGGLKFIERFFERVVVAWSLEAPDDDGNMQSVPPSLDAFREMDAAGARQIEDKLGNHLNKVMGREVEKLEGESEA